MAWIYLALGEPEKANSLLEEAFASRDALLPWVCSDVRYRSLWTLPGLSAFRQRMLGKQPLTVNSRLPRFPRDSLRPILPLCASCLESSV